MTEGLSAEDLKKLDAEISAATGHLLWVPKTRLPADGARDRGGRIVLWRRTTAVSRSCSAAWPSSTTTGASCSGGKSRMSKGGSI
jgi:hypothetical protein